VKIHYDLLLHFTSESGHWFRIVARLSLEYLTALMKGKQVVKVIW